MNKFYLTMVLMVAFAWASAQQVTPTFRSTEGLDLVPVSQTNAKAFSKAKQLQTKGTFDRWFSQPTAFDILNGGAGWADYYAVTVFPDTTMLISGDGSGDHIFMHSMAITMDPASSIFDDDPATDFNQSTAYTMDSIAIGYLYERNTASNVVDTLVVQVQVNGWHYALDANTYSWVNTIYGVSDMDVQAILHAPLTWDAAGNADAHVMKTIKFPLTSTDTNSMGGYFQQAISGVSLAAGEIPKITFTFVPGYSWTANSDSIQMYNRFRFLTYGNASASGYPYYLDGDRNTNQFMRTFAYRDNTDDTYEPAYFFITNPFPYQYHDIWVKFHALNTSINSNEETMSVSQNQPNPFHNTTTINYSLNNKENVNLVIYNVAGAKVMEISEGVKAAGNHTIQLNASQLNAGVYYYTLSAGDNKATKKMIVY